MKQEVEATINKAYRWHLETGDRAVYLCRLRGRYLMYGPILAFRTYETPLCATMTHTVHSETIADDIFDRLAEVQGEAVAGRILATIALDYALRPIKHKGIAFDYFLLQIERQLKELHVSQSDPKIQKKVREIAMNRATQIIEGLRKAHNC